MNNQIKLPNLLIVGAAKAGTTSLHNYLADHPQIFMSKHKEPKYFTSEYCDIRFSGKGDKSVGQNTLKSWEEYLSLFDESRTESILGESSADSLYYHKNVIPAISKKLGDPHIIIILRDPLERAYSAYTHLLRDNRESLSFQEGLDMEDDRIKEGYEFIWHYKNAGMYSESVAAFQSNFTNCKVILFDDLIKNTQQVLNEVYTFLGVLSFVNRELRVYNNSGVPKKNWKSTMFKVVKFVINRSNPNLRRLMPKKLRSGFKAKVKRDFFDNNLMKSKMSSSDRELLAKLLKNDIEILQENIKVDLSHWLNK
jgi:hypothetical protein